MVKTCQHTQKIARMVVLKRFLYAAMKSIPLVLKYHSDQHFLFFEMNLMAKFLAFYSKRKNLI